MTEVQIADGLDDRAARLVTALGRLDIPCGITIEGQEEALEHVSRRCIDGCAMPAPRLVRAREVVEGLLDTALPVENPSGYAVRLESGNIGWET